MIQNKFKIIVPTYNSFNFINDCIMSIREQSYKNFECIVIDDASTDLTWNKANASIHNDKRFILKQNDKNCGPLCNIVYGTSILCKENDKNSIIITVDGDDKLADTTVLEYLNEVYQNPEIWITYGNYKTTSGDPSQNGELNDTRNYRINKIWKTSHLRTYRSKLWGKIKDKSFRDENGEYFKVAGDIAIMFPLLEMAGMKRIKYIQKCLYIYNDFSPLNEFKINMPLLERTREYIWKMLVYDEIQGNL